VAGRASLKQRNCKLHAAKLCNVERGSNLPQIICHFDKGLIWAQSILSFFANEQDSCLKPGANVIIIFTVVSYDFLDKLDCLAMASLFRKV
jgi:hypothetical protein